VNRLPVLICDCHCVVAEALERVLEPEFEPVGVVSDVDPITAIRWE